MSFLTDFLASLSADFVSGTFLKKGVAHVAAGAATAAGKGVTQTVVRGLAGGADTISIMARRALQSDESAKDALNRCIVRLADKDKQLKLAKFFRTLDDGVFANIARNIDDLFADSLSEDGKSRAYQEDDPRIIFLNELADLEVADMLPYLEAFRYDEEPTARTKWKDFSSRLKQSNDAYARRHNLKG